VTRNHYGDRVRAVRTSDRADGARGAYATRELGVRDRLAIGHLQKLVPDARLEARSAEAQRDVEANRLSRPVALELCRYLDYARVGRAPVSNGRRAAKVQACEGRPIGGKKDVA
jgi:hypothetical protein